MDSNIMHLPPHQDEQTFLPYIGNGQIGFAIRDESTIRIKGRV